MSQWLTSGRNRLLEKQQQKQRFGTINNNQRIEQVMGHGYPRAAVSSEIIVPDNNQSMSSQECISQVAGLLSNDMPTGTTSEQEYKARKLMEEQRKQQIFLFLQQQRDIGITFPDFLPNVLPHRPLSQANMTSTGAIDQEISTSLHQQQNSAQQAVLSSLFASSGQQQQQQQHPASVVSATGSKTILDGKMTTPCLDAEVQNECHNIIALENELERQMLQKGVSEELEMVNALVANQTAIMEIKSAPTKQQHCSTAAAEQLLSQFVELDELVARQEMIHRITNKIGSVPANAAILPFDFTNEVGRRPALAEGVGSNGFKNLFGNTASQLLNQQINQQLNLTALSQLIQGGDNLVQQINHNSLLNSNTPVRPSTITSASYTSQFQPTSTPLSAPQMTRLVRGKKAMIKKINADSYTTVNANQDLSIRNKKKSHFMGPASSALSNVSNLANAIPQIVTSNSIYGNGSRPKVPTNEKELEKGRMKPKKRKLLPINVSKCQAPKRQQKLQKKLPMRNEVRANFNEKRSSKHYKKLSGDNKSNRTTSITKKSVYVNNTNSIPGPHHDVMAEIFPSLKKNSKRDEDKMDAANALLGFKKSP